jgi:hypothetical protein
MQDDRVEYDTDCGRLFGLFDDYGDDTPTSASKAEYCRLQY